MPRRYSRGLVVWAAILLLTGCATRFSPGKIRDELALSGLDQLQLAVYESPAESGPAMDVTQIPVRAWEAAR